MLKRPLPCLGEEQLVWARPLGHETEEVAAGLVFRKSIDRGQKARSQLIVTTHDATLMDEELLRRDETWLAEKNDAGATTLRSLGEFKDLRFDTELQRNYLTGRFGGVPVVKHRPYFRAGIHQTI